MTEQQRGSVAEALQGLVRIVGAIAGAVVGIGTLAFSAGFLAQRAQYDFAQVPFVFVDYWAYAEAGFMALVRSMNLFVGHPLCLLLMGGISVAIVLALESDKFRRAVLRPHWTFLGYLILICWLGVVLRQQMVVRELRDGPIVEHVAQADGSVALRSTTVPALFPFVLAVPEALEPPSPDEIRFPPSSVQVWERIADDLERELGEGAVYLEVRPKPSWAVVVPEGEAVLAEGASPVLGVVVEPDQLDSARAEELYRVVLSMFLFGVWSFLLLGAWQKRIYGRISGEDSDGRVAADISRWRFTLHRLREELWFSSRWILRSVAALLLVATGIFLMPECYGLLAMPRLGQEYVEVILEKEDDGEGDETAAKHVVPVSYELETSKAIDLLNQYTFSDHQEIEGEEWRQQIGRMEGNGSADAARVLQVMADASSAISADLSDMAQESLRRVASRTFAAAEGFILYYPRSETDYLRILQRNPHSTAKQWTIFPVKMAEIAEIRVKRDERTVQLVRLLRRMSELDPERRVAALRESEMIGHPRSLEVAIGGTFDPSHRVRGIGITDIGRYAAGLPQAGGDGLRGRLALRRLLDVLHDRDLRPDHRAVAATSLHRFVAVGDEEVCGALVQVLGSSTEELGDHGWPIRGSLITTIGQLRCREAVPRLLDRVEDRAVPVHVRGTIPTQLSWLGTQENSAERLGRLLEDPTTPADVLGSTLTALSLLEGNDSDVAARALGRFVEADSYGEEVEKAGEISYYRSLALDALRQLGNPRSIDTLRRLTDRNREPDYEVRGRAVMALGEFEDPVSESLLMEIAEDSEEPTEVRFAAIRSLRSYHDNSIVRRLVDLYSVASPELQIAILETLKDRSAGGSGYARWKADELLGLEAGSISSLAETQIGSPNGAEPDLMPDMVNVRVGEELQGSLGEGDEQLESGEFIEEVTFVVDQGQTVTVDLISSEFDPWLSVLGPGLDPLIDDDSGGRCNARIELVLPMGGTYLALVSSAGEGAASGDFTLRVREGLQPPVESSCQPTRRVEASDV